MFATKIMSRRSFALYIDLNGEPVDMSLSEFLVHLSTMDNDSKKVNEVVDFILNLEEELRTIASSEYQLPNCMRFLKDGNLLFLCTLGSCHALF